MTNLTAKYEIPTQVAGIELTKTTKALMIWNRMNPMERVQLMKLTNTLGKYNAHKFCVKYLASAI